LNYNYLPAWIGNSTVLKINLESHPFKDIKIIKIIKIIKVVLRKG